MTSSEIPDKKQNNNLVKPNKVENLETPTEGVLMDLIEEAVKIPSNAQLPINKQPLNPDIIRKATMEVAIKYKIQPGVAYAGICCTLQAGGTTRGKRSNIKIRLGEHEFESKVINEILTRITKCSPRQIAKYLANDILKVSQYHNITGNAYIYISRYHPEMLLQQVENEKFWCADFQMDNTDCPEYIRNALRTRFAEKFRKKTRKEPNN